MNGASKFLQQLWQQPLVQYGEAKHLNPISISLICFFLFLFLLLKLCKPPKQTLKFPPSPPKRPIIGNLHQLGTLPHRSLASLATKHGPIMLLNLGQTPTLVVSSAPIAKQVMKTHDLKFSSRPPTLATRLLFYDCQDVGFAPYGEYWRQAKKMCVLELFSAKRVESFQHVRDEEVGVLVRRIRDAKDVVNLSKMLAATSSNIVSRCVLGEKFEDEDGNGRFCDVARKIIEMLGAFCVGDYFPWLGWVDVARGFVGELKRVSRIMDDFFDEVIEEHSLKLKSGKSEDKKDFVDIMLQLGHNGAVDYHFTRDNLKAIIQDMFVGGSDTTSTSLEWAMAELIKSPQAMKKVQQEIRTIVGNKPKIDPNDITKMEYMKCVIKESLRLHPPLPLLVPRETTDSVDVEGYHVAPKTTVLVNAWAIQRDPEFWESPNEFVPERFMDKSKSVDFKGQDFEFVPFGSGRRKCPGLSFGVASLECVLANLLCWFDWKLPNDMAGELLDMTEQYGINVRKKIPLHLNPLPYIGKDQQTL